MKTLADACVSIRVVEALRAHGYDVVWVGDWRPGTGDDEVLARAHAEGRILLTLDKDFGQLAILQGASHPGILRIVGEIRVSEHAARLVKALHDYERDLLAGALVIIEPTRIRIRTAD